MLQLLGFLHLKYVEIWENGRRVGESWISSWDFDPVEIFKGIVEMLLCA